MERKIKSPELLKARNNLFKFIKDNNLDPEKDYSNDKVYGNVYKELLFKLQKERDKVLINYPNNDLRNQRKIVKMRMKKDVTKIKAKKAKETSKKGNEVKESKKAKSQAKEVNEKKAEKKQVRKSSKYDYPLVDGREMTSEEKKKYRVKQRQLANKKDSSTKKEEPKAEKAKAKAAKPKAEKKAKGKAKAEKAKKKKDED